MINNLDVYPNPSKDIFNVELNIINISEVDIEVKSVIGTIIFSESRKKYIGNLTKKIDLSNFSRGTYFLKVKIGASYYYNKLILN